MRLHSFATVLCLITGCADTVAGSFDARDAAVDPPAPTPFVAAPRTDGPFALCGVLGFGTPVAVEVSRDGRTVAIGSGGGAVRLVRASDGANLGVIMAHPYNLAATTFSPDGTSLATAGENGGTRSVRLWRASDGAQLREMPITYDPVHLAFSRDGETLVVVQRHMASALRVADGSALWTTAVMSSPIEAAALSPDDQTLALLSSGAISLLRATDGTLLRALPDSFMRNRRALAFSPDSATLAVGYQHYSPSPSPASAVVARLLRVSDGAARSEISGSWSVNALRFSPDGSALALATDYGPVELWRVGDGAALRATPERRVSTMGGHTSRAVAFSPDGATFVAGSDDAVRFFDADTLRAARTTIETAHVTFGALGWGGGGSVEFAPAGDQLAVGSLGVVRVWDLRSQTVVRKIDDARGVAAFSPDGATIVTGSARDTLQLWSRAAWTVREAPTVTELQSLAFAADGSLLAAGGRDAIALHRPSDGSNLRRIPVARRTLPLFDLAFSHGGSLLAGSTFGGSGAGLDVWRVSDGSRALSLDANLRSRSNFAFTPDDASVLVTPSPGSALTAYAIDGGRQEAPPFPAAALFSVALSPDASLVALGGSNGSVSLRRWPSGELLQTLARTSSTYGGQSLRISRDSRTLVRTGNAGTLEVWCRR